MEQVGFGIIGTEPWSELHARIYNSTQGISLAGVSDIAEEKAESFAQSYGTMHYQDYRTLLQDDLIKAVSIVTPDPTHGEVALAAVRAGKHVLVEPPLAMSVEQCEEIIRVAEQSGVKLMVDFHNRWMPPLCQSRDCVTTAEIGDVEYVSYQVSIRVDVPSERLHRATDTTVAWYNGIRSMDTLSWLLGDEISRVYAVSRSHLLKGMGVDTPDYYQVIVQLGSGASAHTENSWIFPRYAENLVEYRLKVAGSKGVLYVNSGYTEDIYQQEDSFAAESIRHFIDCVVHGHEPQTTGQDGLAATKAVLAVEESARTGVPVDLG